MTATIDVDKIENMRVTMDKRHHQPMWDANIHFKIQTDLGVVQVIVPIQKAQSLDAALRSARGELAGWANEIAQAARSN